MNDPIEKVRGSAPNVQPSDELLARVRSHLMTSIHLTDHQNPTPQRRPRHRRWIAPAAAAAVLATSAAAWAITRPEDPTSSSISCPADSSGGISGVRATTGDPVADCGAEWLRTNGEAPPAMTAHQLPSGEIVVVLEGASTPDGAAPLDAGEAFDSAVLELEEVLSDAGSSFSSGCVGLAEATSQVQGELDRLGLEQWTVAPDDERPTGGELPCAVPVVDREATAVVLVGTAERDGDDGPYEAFARAVDAELASRCMTLADAERVVEDVAAGTDVSKLTTTPFTVAAGLLFVQPVEDATRPCTSASVLVGGRVEVTLRGPA